MTNEAQISTIIVAAACFVLLKAIFGLLGWYSQVGPDALYRSQLGRLWFTVIRSVPFLRRFYFGLESIAITQISLAPSVQPV